MAVFKDFGGLMLCMARIFNKLALGCCLTTLVTVTSCSSTPASEQKTVAHEISKSSAADSTKQEIAALRAEILSLSERMRTNEKNIETLQKGFRSGIFEGESVAPSAPSAQNTATIDVPDTNPPPAAVVFGPFKILADTEMLINQKKYSEAIAHLGDLERQFPNADDGGKSLLLLAECSIALNHPEDAVTSMRRFYLKYPKSPDYLAAKIKEARAHAALGARERALKIYQEVISLGPKTGHAQTARTAIQKLRDER